jgi:hypothetical protein
LLLTGIISILQTDLAQHNHFTKALRNWGSNYFNNTPGFYC